MMKKLTLTICCAIFAVLTFGIPGNAHAAETVMVTEGEEYKMKSTNTDQLLFTPSEAGYYYYQNTWCTWDDAVITYEPDLICVDDRAYLTENDACDLTPDTAQAQYCIVKVGRVTDMFTSGAFSYDTWNPILELITIEKDYILKVDSDTINSYLLTVYDESGSIEPTSHHEDYYSNDNGGGHIEDYTFELTPGTYLFAADSYYGKISGTITKSLLSTDLTLSNVTASPITYGDTLSKSVISGTAVKGAEIINGTWSWKKGNTKPSVSDSGKTEYTVIFTPDESYAGLESIETTATITVNKASAAVPKAVRGLVYNGLTQKGVVEKTGYTLTGNTAKSAGSYTATARLDNNHQWSDGTTAAKKISWSINKATPTVKVSGSNKTVKYSAVKKASTDTTAVAVSGAKGEKTFYKVGGSKKLTISKTSGKIKVAKGTGKGTYSIKIKVKSAATRNYNAKTSAVKTIKVIVK